MNKKEIIESSGITKHLSFSENEIQQVRDYLIRNRLDENSAKHVCKAIEEIRG